MKVLSERNYDLIAYGARTFGTFDPNVLLPLIEEDLYIKDIDEIEAFLTWLHTTGLTIGSRNYKKVFLQFKAGGCPILGSDVACPICGDIS